MENKTPDRFVLSANLVSALIQYLGRKPYEEVAPLLNAIHGQIAPQLPPPEPTDSAAGVPEEQQNQ